MATLGADYDLSVKNPNKVEEVDERTPAEIHQELVQLNHRAKDILDQLFETINEEKA